MSRQSKGKLPRNHSGAETHSGPIAGQNGKTFHQEVKPHNRWLSPAVCLLLALAVWAVFGQTLRHEFVNYDDDIYVYTNPAITRGLDWNGVIRAFTHIHGNNWHPLTTLTHMLDCQLYGLHPAGHHFTNVLLHAATAILLFLVLNRMMRLRSEASAVAEAMADKSPPQTGVLWRCAFVAAVFAIHPLRVESVAWVAERKDVLSGFFFMLTLWAWVRYAQKQASGVWRLASGDYWLALVFFALGLMSKPMLVTLPFVLLLLDYWPLRRISEFGVGSSELKNNSRPSTLNSDQSRAGSDQSRAGSQLSTLLLEKWPFFALSAAACVATILAQQTAIKSVQSFGFPERIGNALVAYAAYLWQTLYPAGLAVFYPHPANRLSIWTVGLAGLVLLAVSAGVMAGRRKHPYLLVGWLWYLGMLVPVIGLMQVGNQARADRYTYLPQIGLCILVAWGAVDLCGSRRYWRALPGWAGAVILAGLLVGAHVQTSYWQDSVTLWTHTLACTSGNPVAHNNLGIGLGAQGKFDEAVQHCEQALQLKPDYVEAHCNLGNALNAEGRLEEAIQHYERALQLKPDYPEALNNLGNALARQGKFTEAIQHYERALQLKPDYAEAHFNSGNTLARQGRLTEAIPHYEQALQLKPDYVEAHINLGNLLATHGRPVEAIPHYERALQFKPDYVEAHINLGNALASQGKLTEAIQHYERALQLKPDFAEVHFILGNALAAQGKSDEAIQHFQQALNLATARNNPGLAEAIRARLKAYPPALPQPQTPWQPELNKIGTRKPKTSQIAPTTNHSNFGF